MEEWFIQISREAQNLADYYGIDYQSALGIIKRGADMGLERAKEIVRETEAMLNEKQRH